jgi:hypothetical protein
VKSEQAGRIEDNSSMVLHDDAHIDLWIVECLVCFVVDLEDGPPTRWAYVSDALPV